MAENSEDEWPRLAAEMGKPLMIRFREGEELRPVVCPNCREPVIWDLAFLMVVGAELLSGGLTAPGLAKGELACLTCRAYDYAKRKCEEPDDG